MTPTAAKAATVASASAYDVLRRRVLDGLERDRVDPATDVDAVRRVVAEAVERYQRSAHVGGDPPLRDPDGMVARLLRSVTAYGPLSDLLADPEVEEVFIEGGRVTWLDRTGRLHGLLEPTTEAEARQVVERLLAPTSRPLDARHPLVQARVLDGAARLTAAIPPVAEALSATIRKHGLRRETLASLVGRGSLSAPAGGVLHALVQASRSVLVSGPPGAGKTSLLAALVAAVPGGRCVRVCEEIRELGVPLPHGAAYETRPPGIDGSAGIDLRELVRFCLGMRPDVLVVGEVRGAEAFELTRAVNAGCGFACTVHANSARDALDALVNAAVMAGEQVAERAVRKVFARALDVVVHCDLSEDELGTRREVREVLAVVPSLHDDFSVEPLFARDAPGAPLRWTGALPACTDAVDRRLPRGIDLRAIAEGRAEVLR